MQTRDQRKHSQDKHRKGLTSRIYKEHLQIHKELCTL